MDKDVVSKEDQVTAVVCICLMTVGTIIFGIAIIEAMQAERIRQEAKLNQKFEKTMESLNQFLNTKDLVRKDVPTEK